MNTDGAASETSGGVPDESPSSVWDSAVRGLVILARLLQGVFVLFAVVFLIGGLQMNVFQFLVIGVIALVLFALVGIVELLAVRPLKGRT